MRDLDGVLARLAARQHSLVTMRQLDELGVTEDQRRVRIARGQWSKADRSVIRLSGAAVTWESQLLAAVLGAGKGATASHRSAAALWGLEDCRKGPPEITIPRGRTYRRKGVRVHESTDLDRTTLTVKHGIPTTLVTRTLLDLGAVVSQSQVQVALEYARRKNLTNWDVLLKTLVVHARRGRDGVGKLRAILDEHFGELAQTDSGFECLVLIALGERGIRQPVIHHPVQIGEKTYHPDLSYPDLMIAIELDGGDHLRREVWENDHVRQNALVNAGWTILRFTWNEYKNHLDRMIRDIRTALKRASQRTAGVSGV